MGIECGCDCSSIFHSFVFSYSPSSLSGAGRAAAARAGPGGSNHNTATAAARPGCCAAGVTPPLVWLVCPRMYPIVLLTSVHTLFSPAPLTDVAEYFRDATATAGRPCGARQPLTKSDCLFPPFVFPSQPLTLARRQQQHRLAHSSRRPSDRRARCGSLSLLALPV